MTNENEFPEESSEEIMSVDDLRDASFSANVSEVEPELELHD